MKIAIVAAHFMPEIGYQEVSIARAFAQLGHDVIVFTSTKHSPSIKGLKKKDYIKGLSIDSSYKYKVHRLDHILSIGANVVSIKLIPVINQFEPDLVVAIGAGKIFPAPLFLLKNRPYKLISLFGDNSDFNMWASRTDRLNNLKSIVLQKLIKNWIYAKAVKSCDKIYFYTPETEKLILSNLPKKLRPLCVRKKVITSLGFDPDEFYFDNGIRNEIRKKYNINDDECVLITSTRIKSSKKLEKIIDIVNEKHLNNIQLRYFIIGFFEDKYCKRLKQYIEKQSKPKKIHCFPFLSHKEIYKLYCGADIGIWTQAAISIQEAMGTGLPIILENKSSVNHLITNGVNGWYFNKNNLNNVFNKVLKTFFSGTPQKRLDFRYYVEKSNLKFSYREIVDSILKDISLRGV